MIEIKNLKKLWEDDGSSVLEGINLTIEDGDIYALVGRKWRRKIYTSSLHQWSDILSGRKPEG